MRPQLGRRSLTWDQGAEMAEYGHIADATGLDVYFCDPNAPWQRAVNENANRSSAPPVRPQSTTEHESPPLNLEVTYRTCQYIPFESSGFDSFLIADSN
ncbi:hypothetical protein HNR25_003796 [Streptomonospora salina]|uniref:Integrase catalytic domain-containing protein n=1 Tax=Streptomonospora salina TaxID=104205 RepID=A0A841EA93_9ACTN|nr:hypothetical protein [Streptomonospora salina]